MRGPTASPERIRSTEGIARSAESRRSGGDLGMYDSIYADCRQGGSSTERFQAAVPPARNEQPEVFTTLTTRNRARIVSVAAYGQIQPRRRAREARRRHPGPEEQVRPVLRRDQQGSPVAGTEEPRGLHPRAQQAEDARQHSALPLQHPDQPLQSAPRVVGPQDARAGRRPPRLPPPPGPHERPCGPPPRYPATGTSHPTTTV